MSTRTSRRGAGRLRSISNQPALHRATRPVVESLENRRLLSAGDLSQPFTFGFEASSSDTPTAVVRLNDGKVLTVGLNSGDGKVILTRLNPGGSLDTTFDGDGRKTVDFGSLTIIRSLTLDNAGRVLATGLVDDGIGGSDMLVARFAANGGLDPTFDGDGIQTIHFALPAAGNALAVSADGTIVVGGATGVVNGPQSFAVAELGDNGALVGGFGNGGSLTTTIGGSAIVRAVIVDGNNNVYAGGESTVGGVPSFTVAKYTPAGALDLNFDGPTPPGNGNGVVRTTLNASASGIRSLAFNNGGLLAIGNGAGTALVQYQLADGQYDPGFNGGAPFQDLNVGVKVLGGGVHGGFIYVERFVSSEIGSVRFTQDSGIQVDTSYGTGGLATSGVVGDPSENSGIPLVSFGADGFIATAAPIFEVDQGSNFGVGTIDADGNTGFTSEVDFALPTFDQTTAVVPLAGGKTLIGGSSLNFSLGRFYGFLSRRLASGGADPSFGDNGQVRIDLGDGVDSVTGVAVDGSGRILVAVSTANGASVLRYSANGILDTNFGTGGVVTVALPGGAFAQGTFLKVAVRGSDVLVTGTASGTPSNSDDFFVARYDGGGNLLDATIVDLGALSGLPGSYDQASTLLVLADGSLVLGGSTDGLFALIHVGVNGVLDTGFGANGLALSNAVGDYSINALAQGSDGTIFTAGATGDGNTVGVAHYSAAGALIGSAGLSSIATYGGAQGLAIDANGKLLVGATLDGALHQIVAIRLTPGLALDGGFGAGGVATANFFGGSDAGAVTIDTDGNVVVAGSTTISPMDSDVAVARFLGDTVVVGNNPHPPTLDAIADQNVNETVLLNFTATAHDIDVPDTLTYSLVGAVPAGASIDPNTGVFSWTPTEAQDGAYIFTVRATDSTGLYDEKSLMVTVHEVNSGPILANPGNKSVNEGQLLSFTLAASDPDTGPGAANQLTYSIQGGMQPGMSLDVNTGEFSWTPTELQDGLYSVTFGVADNGSPSLMTTKTIYITVGEVNQAPTLDAIATPQTVNEGAALGFTAVGHDADVVAGVGNTLTYTLVGGPTGASIDPGTGVFSWTPTEAQDGNHTFTVRVTDNGTGNLFAEQSVTVTVNEVNAAPTLDPIGAQNVNEGSPLGFTATGHDGDTVGGVPNTLTYTLIGAPAGATIGAGSGAFSWTPTEVQDGVYTFTVRVTDNGSPNLFADQSVTVTVNEVNAAPTLANPGNRNVNEGANLSLTLAGSDPDTGPGAANVLTYSILSGGQPGMSLDANTGAFSWTPTEVQDGVYTVTFRVADNGSPNLADTQTITITVGEVNQAPTLDAIATPQNVNEGAALGFTASGHDGDVVNGVPNTLTYSLVGAPAGASIDPGTGVFTWTPTEIQDGNYTFTVRVTDNGTGNLFAQQLVSVTVNEVNAAPTLDAIPAQTVGAGSTLHFTAGGHDADVIAGQPDTLTYSLLGAPIGASIDGGTGVFSWTPTLLQSGTYNFTVQVADGSGAFTTRPVTVIVTPVAVNVPPLVNPISGLATGLWQTQLNFTGTFSDPGDVSVHAQAWTVKNSLNVVVATGTGANFGWTPTAVGTFIVTFTVTDGGNLSGSASQLVSVTSAALVGGVLKIMGSGGADTIQVTKGVGTLLVSVDGQPVQIFTAALVNSILVQAGDGADTIAIATGIAAPAELHGGAGNDTITVGNGNDSLYGEAGDDSLSAGGDDDQLFGGDGNDTLSGGTGNDLLYGGAGNDSLDGGGGDDILFGEAGNDVLSGSAGNDVFVGGDGNDAMFGGAGRDVLIGGLGSDLIQGDAGDDILIAGATSHDTDPAALSSIRSIWLTGGDYTTRVNTLRGNLLKASNVFNDSSIDLLSGNAGRDWIIANTGGGAPDVILGLQGNEIITPI